VVKVPLDATFVRSLGLARSRASSFRINSVSTCRRQLFGDDRETSPNILPGGVPSGKSRQYLTFVLFYVVNMESKDRFRLKYLREK